MSNWPPIVVAFLAAISAGLAVHWYFARNRNLMIIGKAIPRVYIAIVYVITQIGDYSPNSMSPFMRSGLVVLLLVEILYGLAALRMGGKRNGTF